jgi:cytosine/adenosine deaminase-related metal-dependent hydrolase
VPGLQLAHAGRKASAERPWEGRAHIPDDQGGWPTIAPSAIAFGGPLSKVPQEMTLETIARIKRAFADGARRALAAGVRWLELHGAHGYLLNEFLSPLANHRTDEYGGTFEHRIRFALETVRGVRAIWPDPLPLAIRLSCTDWDPAGWTIEDTVDLARRLKGEGVDLVDCSSGGATREPHIPVAPGYHVPFAERVRREAGIATAAVGLITEPAQADEIVRTGRADLVLLAREMLRDPNAIVSLSDAGAHLTFLCDAGFGLHLLGHWVRGRRVMPVEQAVRKLTAEPADLFGIRGRGRLAPGQWADLLLFDPATVGRGKPQRVFDLPAGASRLTTPGVGVHGVWVNGERIANADGIVPGAPTAGHVLREFAA